MSERDCLRSEEILRHLNALKKLKDDLQCQIECQEHELVQLDDQLRVLNEKRIQMISDIDRRKEAYATLESSLSNATVSYQKPKLIFQLLESSQSLVAFMEKEKKEIQKLVNSGSQYCSSEMNSSPKN
ncbi:Structural maintenance of chromosomes protein [Trichinella spiralis]|uniref:Structural maintenance of chromosomes protein n=1 Tax=Trichinella spiralis TaxID=6334 RepID=A0ABR3KHY5_TRISP